MQTPSMTSSLLAGLGLSPSLSPHASTQPPAHPLMSPPSREPAAGAFARELQKLQAQSTVPLPTPIPAVSAAPAARPQPATPPGTPPGPRPDARPPGPTGASKPNADGTPDAAPQARTHTPAAPDAEPVATVPGRTVPRPRPVPGRPESNPAPSKAAARRMDEHRAADAADDPDGPRARAPHARPALALDSDLAATGLQGPPGGLPPAGPWAADGTTPVGTADGTSTQDPAGSPAAGAEGDRALMAGLDPGLAPTGAAVVAATAAAATASTALAAGHPGSTSVRAGEGLDGTQDGRGTLDPGAAVRSLSGERIAPGPMAGPTDADGADRPGPPQPPRAASAAASAAGGATTLAAAGRDRSDAAGAAPGDVQTAASARPGDPQHAAAVPQPAAGLPSFAAELARASSAATGSPLTATTSGQAPKDVTLATPVHAPDFLPRLGGELAVLARDGVQEARINVHPVELGPISVQISLDGTTAQVHLAVDNAQTRELLEQAMPSLANALRETGLTLTGGGVFQQSRQAPQGQPAAEGRSSAQGRTLADDGEVDAALAIATPRRLRPMGALDVFA